MINLSKLKKFWKESEIPSKIALVIWEDTHVDDEDESVSPHEYDDPDSRLFYMWEVGWVIKDDDIGVAITHLWYFDGDIVPPSIIPRSAVRYMRYLK